MILSDSLFFIILNLFQLTECKSKDQIFSTISTIPSTSDVATNLPDATKQIHVTKCSRKCGEGEQTISNISWKCPAESPCFLDIQEYKKTCNLEDCPPSIKFGPWSDWSECSLSCKNDYQQKSVRSRIRTLQVTFSEK